MKLFMFTHSGGVKSFTLTASVFTLATVLAKVLLADTVIGPVHVGGAPDSGTIAALLTPTLGAYVFRRGQEKATP